MTHKTANQLTEMLLKEKQQQYNNFKTNQDRKYAIYSLLQHNQKPFILEKFNSNQINVYDTNGKILYCNDTETTQQKTDFPTFLKDIITTWINTNFPNGHDV